MAQIIPIRDLKDTTAISERCKQTNEPIFVTKNGYGDMVVMGIDVYNRTFAEMRLYKELKEAEDEIARGEGIPFAQFRSRVKEKYGI